MVRTAEQHHSRADVLANKFKRGVGTNIYIDKAIDLDRRGLKLCQPGHPKRANSLTCLATHLRNRYDRVGNIADLEEAIALDREALDLRPHGNSHRSTSLSNLAVGLSARYCQLGVMEDLNKAIVLHQEALDLRPHGHPDRSMLLNNLAVGLSTRYDQLGVTEDLNRAILLHQEALDLRPHGHPDQSMSLSNIAVDLSTRYRQLGVMEDLNKAVVLYQEALDLRPHGHPDRSTSLSNLAVGLSTRYNQLGVMDDLNEAIVLHQEALDLRPNGHPDRPVSLSNLAVGLSKRYGQLGVMEDLNEAIVLHREALDLRPNGHPDRSMSLSNLAVGLSARYDQLRVMEDLNEAIVLHQEALDLRPHGHPGRSTSLNNLATDLSTWYDQLGVMEDLNETIILHQEALNLEPHGHPGRSMSLNNLAVGLSTRYERLGVMEDLNNAIILQQEALDLEPHGHPGRPMSLNNLAVVLSTRYAQLGAMQDLNKAIVLHQEALDLRPHGHPSRSMSLRCLVDCLCERFMRSKQPEDREELFNLCAHLVHHQAVSSADVLAAKEWIRVAESFQHITTVLAYETSLRLLIQHLATLPSLPRHLPILKDLSSSLAVDAFSACLRSHSPVKAVELLEQGRGLFWSQLTRLRSPLADLIASRMGGKLLADNFMRLASRIRDVSDSPDPGQHGQLCHLNLEMQSVVTSIRQLPGFSRFLLPSLFSDLRRASSRGPVIIVNASKYSCDVLIILVDSDPVHIPLQITQESVRDLANELHILTTRARRVDMTRALMAFLRKLWDQIVSPIVEFLRTKYPLQSHILWCPTADFSVLPLHAAGPFRKGHKNLPDLYISSYTPTLSALVRARQHRLSNVGTQEKRFVAIGQANAAGERELPSVGVELSNIAQLVRVVASFTRMDGEASCMSRVVEALGQNEWVHFACHGLANRTHPFESAFALRDGWSTIERMVGCDLKTAEFAYLSACHTAVGDEESPDEVIHLASAMEFIGFRSVIGTMWAVDDSETNKITSMFYKHMVDESGRLDYTRAAYALNKTMRTVDIPLDQRVLYIHLGA